MKHILLFVVFTLSVQSAIAFNIFSSKLKFYGCDSAVSAMSCTKCTPDKSTDNHEIFIDFKVDKKQRLVIYQVYENDKVTDNGRWEKCSIIDKSNWICRDEYSLSAGNKSIIKVGMNNNIFYDTMEFESPGIPGTSINPSKTQIFSCAR